MPAAELYKFAQSKDPKAEMLKVIGDLSKIDIAGAKVLVWPYIRSLVRPSGLIAGTDNTAREDVYQGAVGYVLKAGPVAFKDDPALNINFAGFKADAGDWVTFSPGDGKRIQINGVDCRLFEDSMIQMKVADPDVVTHRQ